MMDWTEPNTELPFHRAHHGAAHGITCPKCESMHTEAKHWGRQACGALGGIAGAYRGGIGAWSGMEIGSSIGLIMGPGGAAVGGFTGAIFGALLGCAAGGTLGAKVGQFIDQQILKTYRCLDCGHSFSDAGVH